MSIRPQANLRRVRDDLGAALLEPARADGRGLETFTQPRAAVAVRAGDEVAMPRHEHWGHWDISNWRE